MSDESDTELEKAVIACLSQCARDLMDIYLRVDGSVGDVSQIIRILEELEKDGRVVREIRDSVFGCRYSLSGQPHCHEMSDE